MRVFYDWEFVERGPLLPIQPIAGGFVAEDGRELYVINEECLSNVLRDPWLSVNVKPGLPIRQDVTGPNSISEWDRDHPEYANVVPMDTLVQYVHGFLTATPSLELWAYYSAYDHVVNSQLFGSMQNLPPGIPMWTHELQQLIESSAYVKLPPEPGIAHHALWDARWNAEAFKILMQKTTTSTIEAMETQFDIDTG
jgi:hypothetical protein